MASSLETQTKKSILPRCFEYLASLFLINALNTSDSTHFNIRTVQSCTALEHELELEKLKNQHLRQQVSEQKQLIESYQQQIGQLNKTLEKANASIHDFARVRLLEFRQSEPDDEIQSEQKQNTEIAAIAEKKKRWWGF